MKFNDLATETVTEILSYSVWQCFRKLESHQASSYEIYSREDGIEHMTCYEKPNDESYGELINYAHVCRQWGVIIEYQICDEINNWEPQKFRKTILDAARRGFLLIVEMAFYSKKAPLLKADGRVIPWDLLATETPAVGFFGNILTALPKKTTLSNGAGPPLELEAMNAAASQDKYAVVKLLIEQGVDVDGTPALGQRRCRQTPLFQSAVGFCVETTQLLLANGAKVNARTSEMGKTALFGAVKSGTRPHPPGADEGGPKSLEAITATKSLVMTRLLLLKGADPMLVADNNQTVLWLAAANGHCETVRLLLKAGCHTQLENTPNFNNHTPLMAASVRRHCAVVQLLIENGANLDARSSDDGLDALGLAIKGYEGTAAQCNPDPSASTVRTLLNHGADIDGERQPDHSSMRQSRPLSLAIYWGNVPAIQHLLRYGADLERVDHNGKTPLEGCLAHRTGQMPRVRQRTMAAWMMATDAFDETSMEIFQILLEGGANVNHQTPKKKTLLHEICARQGLGNGIRVSIITKLLEHGANVNEPDFEGSTPLIIACQNVAFDLDETERLKVISELQAYDVDVERTNYAGVTALITACQNATSPPDDVRAVESLLAYGADVDSPDPYGDTPSMVVCKSRELSTHRKLRLKEVLMSHGGNQNLVNGKGDTALMTSLGSQSVALGTHDFAVTCALLNDRVDVNVTNSNGDSALMIVCGSGLSFEDKLYTWERLVALGADPNHFNHEGDTVTDKLAQNLLPGVQEAGRVLDLILPSRN